MFYVSYFSSCRESSAADLAVCAFSRGGRPVDHPGRRRGEAEDGGLGPGRRAASDRPAGLQLSCGALWGAPGPELEGRGAAQEPELQRILPGLPHRRQELPEGTPAARGLPSPEQEKLVQMLCLPAAGIAALPWRRDPGLQLGRVVHRRHRHHFGGVSVRGLVLVSSHLWARRPRCYLTILMQADQLSD